MKAGLAVPGQHGQQGLRALRSHPLLLATTALVGPRFLVAALVLVPLLGLALNLALPPGPAMGVTMALALALAPWPLWVAPLGGLLITQRHRRTLRLPAPPLRQLLPLVAWALLLLVGLPLVAVALHKPEGPWLLFSGSALLLAMAVWPLFVLLPMFALGLLGLATSAGLVLRQWLPALSGSAGPDGSLEQRSLLLLVLATGAALAAWGLARRFVRRPGPVTGLGGCLLDLSELGASGRSPGTALWSPLGHSKALWLQGVRTPTRSPHQRQRLATVLGPPYAQRDQLVLLGGMAAGLLVYASVMGWFKSFGDAVPLMLALTLGGATAPFSQRLSQLIRPDTPELAELALLPGFGAPAAQGRDLLRVLCLQPLATVLTLGALLGVAIAWLAPAFAAVPLALVGALGLLALETATVVGRGRPLFRNPATGPMVQTLNAMLLSLGCWAALRFEWPVLLAAVLGLALLLLALGAWRLRQAWQQARTLPRPLMAEGERAAA